MAITGYLSAWNEATTKGQFVNTEYRGVTPLKFYEPLNITLRDVFQNDNQDQTIIAIAPISVLGAVEYIRIYAISSQGGYTSLDEAVTIEANGEEDKDHTFEIEAFIIPGKTSITQDELTSFVKANALPETINNTRTFFGFPCTKGMLPTTIASANFIRMTQKVNTFFKEVKLQCAGRSLALCRDRLSNMAWKTDSNELGIKLTGLDENIRKTLKNGGAGMLCVRIVSDDGELSDERKPENFARYNLVAEYSVFETHSGSISNGLPGMYSRKSY